MSHRPQDSATEAELIALRSELDEARTTQHALEAAVRARDDFITIAAHELRSPMSAILLYVQNLTFSVQRDQNACSAEIKADLARLEKRIDHFIKRAGVLLDVTRLTSGNFCLERADVDLTALTERVVRDFLEEARRAECAIELDLAPAVSGQWDELALEQVLVNLLSNAIKYGAGHPVSVRVAAHAGAASIRVEDRGIGISEEACSRIFDKFERAVHRSTHGGFGVGLWITRQIVEALGGRIAVESRPGSGSTFSVSLPRAALNAPSGECHR
jgi:signal transduction histidine kinase